ncbi:hypothetical protein C2E23DRAFT_237367 [Lenzites betulinus]|nr:hypothetical protein C2E23DRAFT_237367 [Lenzites betulinus]
MQARHTSTSTPQRTNTLVSQQSPSIMQFLATLAALAAVTGSTLAYDNNCAGSALCSVASFRKDCQKAIASVNPGGTYTDQTQFSVGHCYMIYAAGSGKGAQPISGQRIIDTATLIMNQCVDTCGSFGTGNAGCDTCHITLNYRG